MPLISDRDLFLAKLCLDLTVELLQVYPFCDASLRPGISKACIGLALSPLLQHDVEVALLGIFGWLPAW